MLRSAFWAVTALWCLSTSADRPSLHSRQATPPIFQVPAAAWKSLNTSVGGRLSLGLPVAYPCFENYNGTSKKANLKACSVVEQQKTNTFYLAEQFGGWEYSNWAQCQAAGTGCSLSSGSVKSVAPVSGQCYQGSIPTYYINITSPADVQAGLNFSQQYGVPLVVKNSGHDYKGRSSAPYSLALWTYTYQPAITKINAFTPQGCASSVGSVISYGAGQDFDGIYRFAHANNFVIVGGSSGTVGAAGGWLTGGGHSALSNTLGLGVDNVEQIGAVLPNGTYVIASRCTNTDIFFALRGGGGNAFGILMETWTRVHQVQPLQFAQFEFGALNQSQLLAFMIMVVQNTNAWATQGWGGYMLPAVSVKGSSSVSMLTPSLSLQQAKAALAPMTKFFTQANVTVKSQISTIPSYWNFYQSALAGSSVGSGIGTVLSSRLVPSEYYNGVANQNATAQALANLLERTRDGDTYPYKPLLICLTTPSSYVLPETDQTGGPGAASVTPAWRISPHHIIYTRAWNPTDPTAGGAGSVSAAFQDVHDAMNALRTMTPDGGAYQNEADPFEPDPIDTFWGQDNYNQLLTIKTQIDPNNIMSCHQCIGWNSSSPRYDCYPSITT